MATCDSCGRPFGRGRRPVETITKRRVCEPCNARILGLAAGVLANPGAPVVGAIATEGWFARIRARRTRRAQE